MHEEKEIWKKAALLLSTALLLTGCSAGKAGTPDDYAINKGYEEDTAQKGSSEGIAKEDIKVGVLYLSDPSDYLVN